MRVSLWDGWRFFVRPWTGQKWGSFFRFAEPFGCPPYATLHLEHFSWSFFRGKKRHHNVYVMPVLEHMAGDFFIESVLDTYWHHFGSSFGPLRKKVLGSMLYVYPLSGYRLAPLCVQIGDILEIALFL